MATPHLSNFGLFGTPERQLIFDINDFDETLPGPWEWDVKRMAASFEVMGRHQGFRARERHDVVMTAVREYRERMRRSAGLGTLDSWYDQLDASVLLKLVRQEVRLKRLNKKDAATAERRVEQAYACDSTRVFTRRAADVEGELRIRAEPPLVVPIEDLAAPGSEWEDPSPLIKSLLQSYRRTLGRYGHPLEEFRYVHAARKVVGVGSVGTRCYILLMVGRDPGDPLFLQVKEAQACPGALRGKSRYGNHGERVVVGQRLMQAATDIFLGWERIRGLDGHTRDYYIRQFHDWKGGAEVENLGPSSAAVYARFCGGTPGARTCPLGRPHRDRGLLGRRRLLRPGRRRVLRPLRGPERGRLRGVRPGRQEWASRRDDRCVGRSRSCGGAVRPLRPARRPESECGVDLPRRDSTC